MGRQTAPAIRPHPRFSFRLTLLSGLVLLLVACSPSQHYSFRAWVPVTYGGITIYVPPNWPVYQRSQQPCGISGPGVLVGPPSHIFELCPFVRSLGPVLTFSGTGTIPATGPEHRETINGVEAVVSKSTYTGGELSGVVQWTSEEVVRLPGRGVWLRAYAPGKQSAGALRVMDEVVATSHAS